MSGGDKTEGSLRRAAIEGKRGLHIGLAGALSCCSLSRQYTTYQNFQD